MADKYVIFGATYDGDGTTSSEAVGATVTITIASPGVVTWNGHGLSNNDVVYLETTGALPTGLSGTGTYYVRNAATNTFELSLTSGGASINTSVSQSGTHYASRPGAWRATNSTGTTLTAVVGTINHGALSAGDTVYTRSKTGNGANADITFPLTASTTIGSASATLASPITWILDGGTTWSGQNGVLKYTTSSGSFTITLRDYNRFIARTKHNWIIECSAGVPASNFFQMNATETDGLLLQELSRNASLGGTTYGNATVEAGHHRNFKVKWNRHHGAAETGRSMIQYEGSTTVGGEAIFDNPEFEITTAGTGGALFTGAGYFCNFVVRGGRLFGDGAGSGIRMFFPATSSTNGFRLESAGFDLPKVCTVIAAQPPVANVCRMYGLDGGTGAEIQAHWGGADTRNYTANYPYLNATLPDSAASPCTWRVVPAYATFLYPVELPMSVLYTQAAAAKTVTLQMLVSDNWGAGVINKNSVWMTVSYVDNSTSARVTETTRLVLPGTDLDADSAAGWSATSWGAVNFGSAGKRKLSLTTAGSIKQDTTVIVTFYCSAKSTTTTYDMFVVDPSPQLS